MELGEFRESELRQLLLCKNGKDVGGPRWKHVQLLVRERDEDRQPHDGDEGREASESLGGVVSCERYAAESRRAKPMEQHLSSVRSFSC